MARNELGERIDHGNDWLAKILVLHAGGAPEAAGARHVAAVGRGSGAVGGHGLSFWEAGKASFRRCALSIKAPWKVSWRRVAMRRPPLVLLRHSRSNPSS